MRRLIAIVLVTFVAAPAMAQTPQTYAMPPLAMTGMGGGPTVLAAPPAPQTFTMPPLAMTGLGGGPAAPSAAPKPQSFTMPPLAMTGGAGGASSLPTTGGPGTSTAPPPFVAKTVRMTALAMTGMGRDSVPPPAKSFTAKTVRMQRLVMTGLGSVPPVHLPPPPTPPGVRK